MFYPGNKGDCSTFRYILAKELLPNLPHSVYFGSGFEQIEEYARYANSEIIHDMDSINKNPGIYIISNDHHMELLIYDFSANSYISCEYHIGSHTIEIASCPNNRNNFVISMDSDKKMATRIG